MQSEGSIFIAGHSGLAGSAILRALQSRGYSRLIVRTHQELELTDARAVKEFFQQERPESVFLAAAKVGGIQANNTLPAEFLRENLLIQTHVLHEAWQAGVKKCFFGEFVHLPEISTTTDSRIGSIDRRIGANE